MMDHFPIKLAIPIVISGLIGIGIGIYHDNILPAFLGIFIGTIPLFVFGLMREQDFVKSLKRHDPNLGQNSNPKDWSEAYVEVFGDSAEKRKLFDPLMYSTYRGLNNLKNAQIAINYVDEILDRNAQHKIQEHVFKKALPQIKPYVEKLVFALFPDSQHKIPLEFIREQNPLFISEILGNSFVAFHEYLAEQGYLVDRVFLDNYASRLLNSEIRKRIIFNFKLVDESVSDQSDLNQIASATIIAFGDSPLYTAFVARHLCLSEPEFENAVKLAKDSHEKKKQKDIINGVMNGEKLNRSFLTINDVDIMDGTEFEYFLAELFEVLGYNTKVTKASGDQGADLIIEKLGVVAAVQAKCYSQPVSNKAVQEVVAAKMFYIADHAMVVTNSFFTKSAIHLAAANEVELWDRDILSSKLDEAHLPIPT